MSEKTSNNTCNVYTSMIYLCNFGLFIGMFSYIFLIGIDIGIHSKVYNRNNIETLDFPTGQVLINP